MPAQDTAEAAAGIAVDVAPESGLGGSFDPRLLIDGRWVSAAKTLRCGGFKRPGSGCAMGIARLEEFLEGKTLAAMGAPV